MEPGGQSETHNYRVVAIRPDQTRTVIAQSQSQESASFIAGQLRELAVFTAVLIDDEHDEAPRPHPIVR